MSGGQRGPAVGRPERILVLCRPILGDMILAGPVFRSLRAWRPEARITALCYQGKRDFLRFATGVDEVLEIPRGRGEGRGRRLARWWALLSQLRAARFDLVYDIMQTDRSSALCAWTGAPVRVGFIKGTPRLRHRVYTHTAPWIDADVEGAHAVDLYLAPLAAARVPVATRSVRIRPSPEETASARARLGALALRGDRPLVVCHPGASSANKCWPLEELAAACDAVQEEIGARLVLIGGPGEGEALHAVRARMRGEAALIPDALPVGELAALLAEADLFFGHDSGPMHVAAAVGTPTVGLFGASRPAQWRPLGEGHTVVRPSMPCSPCPYPSLCEPPNPYKMYCVRRIGRAEVVAALRCALGAGRGETA